ncbi:MAG TPA: DinB family protein [Chitinophagaceae bacterium]
MTKNYFIQLADYNIWANNIIHSWLGKITDEQWEQPIVSSFKNIAETTVHTAGAEKIWLERLNNVEMPVFLTSVFKGTKQEAIEIWKKTSLGLKSFIENFDETKMQDNVSFRRPNGNIYELEHYQIFAHVLNHSTYHRGQIVTMLRQVGFTDLSSMDLSTFFWNK